MSWRQFRGPATLIGLEEAEKDAVSAAGKFEAYEPPSGDSPSDGNLSWADDPFD